MYIANTLETNVAISQISKNIDLPYIICISDMWANVVIEHNYIHHIYFIKTIL